MRNQEIYDIVRSHLLTQGERAYMPGSSTCGYRGEKPGTSCAVGCLILNEDYRQDMEGPILERPDNPDSALVWNALRNRGIGARNYALLRTLQNIHDGAGPECWVDDLNKCAKRFKLKVNANV